MLSCGGRIGRRGACGVGSVGTAIAVFVLPRKRRRGTTGSLGGDSVIVGAVAALLLSSCREVLLSHVNLQNIVGGHRT